MRARQATGCRRMANRRIMSIWSVKGVTEDQRRVEEDRKPDLTPPFSKRNIHAFILKGLVSKYIKTYKLFGATFLRTNAKNQHFH